MTLQTSGLACARGHRQLFEGIDLTVQPGEALRVAGRNGSGKTSLLRLLCGLAEPSQGEVRWQGQDIRQARDDFHRDLLYIGHGSGVKDDLTALENIQIGASLSGHPCTPYQAGSALARLGLADRAHLPARALSQGQRRRLALARLALQPAPRLAILDEPFNALDTESIQVLSDLLNEQLAQGTVVVYTTHQSQALVASRTIELNLDERTTSHGSV
jgi:heme exporter protein A